LELLEKEAEERTKATIQPTTEETVVGYSSAEAKTTIPASSKKQATGCPFSSSAKPGEAPPHAIAATAEPCCKENEICTNSTCPKLS
jgi:hypothetical protein